MAFTAPLAVSGTVVRQHGTCLCSRRQLRSVPRHNASHTLRMTLAKSPVTAPRKFDTSPDTFPKPGLLPPHLAAFLSRAKEGDPAKSLVFAERAFDQWKRGPRPFKTIAHDERNIVDGVAPDVDVVIAGGTLGIFYATALSARGVRVALVERGKVQGRAQEWNISREELRALVDQQVLTPAQLDEAIVNQFPGGSRIIFPGSDAITVKGVLDIGVCPATLVAKARERFEQLGGVIYEFNSLDHVAVRANCVQLSLRAQQRRGAAGDGSLGAGGTSAAVQSTVTDDGVKVLRARLLIDAMGSFSPIAAQVREGARPDGACIVVGSCMSSITGDNESSDLLCAIDGINSEKAVQYFWEAFPAGRDRDRRTTYMFSYGECSNDRQTLTDALDDYVRTLPRYQSFDLSKVEVERILFAFFPVFRDSPSRIAFDRVLPVGDAAGFQSPISFGGFGACLRHLKRVTDGVYEALSVEEDNDILLSRRELQRLQFYNPSLSATWLFNSSMSVYKSNVPKKGPRAMFDENIINDLLGCNMKTMQWFGPSVQKPFLQDVVRAKELTLTILGMMVSNPMLSVRTAFFVRPIELAKWTPHYLALVLYTLLLPVVAMVQKVVGPRLNAVNRYRLNRLVDALRYGSGLDHVRI